MARLTSENVENSGWYQGADKLVCVHIAAEY